jgi:eukaryotic-like serine/threonine-protein kinase
VQWLDRPIEGIASTASGNIPKGSRGFDLPRTMAGRYRLDVLSGEGGFGRVYRGFDTWLERPVAVKVPRMDRPVTVPMVDLCRLEARKVARLKHPHIVAVHDVGQDGGSASSSPSGSTAWTWPPGSGPIAPPYPEAARIVAEVAEALGYAHRMGYVHRDIKPANILLDRQGEAYLTDFGIAVVEAELLGDKSAAGTLPYMAPEQLHEAPGPMDHWADIYSLGVVLYELLTGRRPFRAASPIELREQILGVEPQPPRSIVPDAPAGLETICLRCLTKRPEDRYQGAVEVEAALRAYLGS